MRYGVDRGVVGGVWLVWREMIMSGGDGGCRAGS